MRNFERLLASIKKSQLIDILNELNINSEHKKVLHERYVNGLYAKNVAIELNLTESTVYAICKKYVQLLSEKIVDFSKEN